MMRMDVTQLREALADAVNRVGFGHERILLERHGKAVAALVPVRDLERLEGLPVSESLATHRTGDAGH